MGIPVKDSESTCTRLLKLLAKVYSYTDSIVEECFKTKHIETCREARNYLYRLYHVLGFAVDNACVKGAEDLVEEVKTAIREVERILREAGVIGGRGV
jgi:hypothetical protein